MTTAAASPDLIRAMLQSVAVESVATSSNVTVDLDEGNALANILAFGSRTMQNSMIGGCCDQYGSILKSLTNNSGHFHHLPANLMKLNACLTCNSTPPFGPTQPVYVCIPPESQTLSRTSAGTLLQNCSFFGHLRFGSSFPLSL